MVASGSTRRRLSRRDPNAVAKRLLVTVVGTTLGWLAVTFATRPESLATLVRFYRTRPARRVRLEPDRPKPHRPRKATVAGIALIEWIAGLGLVFGTLFAIGKLIFGDGTQVWSIWCWRFCGALIRRSLGRG